MDNRDEDEDVEKKDDQHGRRVIMQFLCRDPLRRQIDRWNLFANPPPFIFGADGRAANKETSPWLSAVSVIAACTSSMYVYNVNVCAHLQCKQLCMCCLLALEEETFNLITWCIYDFSGGEGAGCPNAQTKQFFKHPEVIQAGLRRCEAVLSWPYAGLWPLSLPDPPFS